MALIGYARSSTEDQHPEEVQVPRLVEAGCTKVFCDIGQSGAKASRPEWDKALAYLREGDVLVSVKLDRSVQHLLQVAADLEIRGVGLKCLDQPIDTTTPVGKLIFTILAAVAEFERALVIERTQQGLVAARARGHMGGRPKSYTGQQCQVARMLRDAGEMTAQEIADLLGFSRATYFRALQDFMITDEAVSA
jgi:DNA invertase Pin-like site-specific DNA recombinase